MNKKFLIGIGIMFVGVLFIIIKLVIPNDKLSKLEKYNLLENESIKNEFKIENKKYILTTYYKNDSSYAYNNLLLKNRNDYYLLESINKCDMSYYIKNNEIYVHCIGKKGNILKYTIDDYKLEKDIMELDYKDAPNISQIHITIDGADNDYIYLRSNVKNNDSIKEGEFVKCSLSTKKCEYYNRREITNVENVSISISDISLTGATITIKDTNKKPYVYGEWYRIEKEDNGEWFALETKIQNYGFNDLGYEVGKNNEVKFVIDWQELYGELPLGSYRIVKQVNNQYIYVDFGIATTSSY